MLLMRNEPFIFTLYVFEIVRLTPPRCSNTFSLMSVSCPLPGDEGEDEGDDDDDIKTCGKADFLHSNAARDRRTPLIWQFLGHVPLSRAPCVRHCVDICSST